MVRYGRIIGLTLGAACLVAIYWHESNPGAIRAVVDVVDSSHRNPKPDLQDSPKFHLLPSREEAVSSNAPELASELTAEDASEFLWGEGQGFPSTARREALWKWLKTNPQSDHFREILAELLTVIPPEMAPELIGAFPSMEEAVKADLMIFFANTLSEIANSEERNDITKNKIRDLIVEFVETQLSVNSRVASIGYEALLRSPNLADDEVRTRVFFKFMNLSAEEIVTIYPAAETGIPSTRFWARKVASYAQSLESSQATAIQDILARFPSLDYPEKQEIAAVFLKGVRAYDRYHVSNQDLADDGAMPKLTPQGKAMLDRNKDLLEPFRAQGRTQ